MAHHLTAIFVFLLATLAATSFGAPVEGRTFSHSCGRGVISESNTDWHRVRHGVANTSTTSIVECQIELAITHFKNDGKIIKYFEGLTEWTNTSYNYSWLPQKQLDWYKSICSLKQDDRMKEAFQAFNSSLQTFSDTFEKLMKFSPKINATIRNKIINETFNQLKLVRCEVESALILNETTTERVPEDFLSKTINLDHNPDTTRSMVQDWGVISLFKEFLTDWKVIVSSLNKPNACKTRRTKKSACKKGSNKKKKGKKTKGKKPRT